MKRTIERVVKSRNRWQGLEGLESRTLLTAITVIANGAFPRLTNDNTPTLSGTVDNLAATVDVTITHTGGALVGTFGATVDGTGNWTFTVANPDALAEGHYDLTIAATANGGADTGQLDLADSLTVDVTGPVETIESKASSVASPGLQGLINDATAFVVVRVQGVNYAADNHGNGTWSLNAGTIAALPDGVYPIQVTGIDLANNQTVFSGAFLVIDTAAPVVTVNKLLTTNTSPALGGTIDDGGATISVHVDGADYSAVNNGDGTWTLAGGTIAALAQGTYPVTVTAVNALGTVGMDATTNELTVGASQTVTVGAGISKVIYVDGDGTTVTTTAGKGQVALTFIGVNAAVAGTGNTRTVTATGGILQVDVNVQAASSNLTINVNASGDGQTTIHQITGTGNLTNLNGKGVTLSNGINMTGAIQKLKVHAIKADVTMGTVTNGVSITADTIEDSTITTGNVSGLTVRQSFKNSNVVATTVGNVNLANVEVDNDGVAFGITSTTTKSLKLKQAGATLQWKKNFLNGIQDFFIVG